MKINPIGIQSYQQTAQQPRHSAIGSDPSGQTVDSSKVSIPVQEEAGTSRLAVKLPNENYGKFLSTEERQTLDLLFSRFRDASRFGAGYTRDMEAGNTGQTLGQVVDLKV